tara:strand:+ start:683 stop:862 length:180 start_codon:yes stop_codon:yes gene_type:complete
MSRELDALKGIGLEQLRQADAGQVKMLLDHWRKKLTEMMELVTRLEDAIDEGKSTPDSD